MVAHDISGDIAPGESESQFIARLIDEAYTKTDPAKPITADDELITIELKDNVLSLGDWKAQRTLMSMLTMGEVASWLMF